MSTDHHRGLSRNGHSAPAGVFIRSHRSCWTAIAAAMRLATCIVLACVCAPAMAAQNVSVSADAVKAAFLYNFGSYVEWPPEKAPDAEIGIGIIGAEGIARELRSLLPGRTIQNRGVTVRTLSATDSLEGIQMLYVGELRGAQLTRVLEAARRSAILVITDTPEGIQRGSMINFVLDERRVRFEISRAAAEQAGLKLSSRLLAVALRVHSSGLIFDPTPAPFVFAHYRKLTSMRFS